MNKSAKDRQEEGVQAAEFRRNVARNYRVDGPKQEWCGLTCAPRKQTAAANFYVSAAEMHHYH